MEAQEPRSTTKVQCEEIFPAGRYARPVVDVEHGRLSPYLIVRSRIFGAFFEKVFRLMFVFLTWLSRMPVFIHDLGIVDEKEGISDGAIEYR